MLNWTGSFVAVASVGLIAGAVKRGNPAMVAPLLPLGYILGACVTVYNTHVQIVLYYLFLFSNIIFYR